MVELIPQESPGFSGWMGRVVQTHGTLGEEDHQGAAHRVVAARLAALLDLPYMGVCEGRQAPAPTYLVPRSTLSGPQVASAFLIRSEDDLFGGWVLRRWMGTKAIMHPVLSSEAAAPAGWSHRLAADAAPLTLRGITAFSVRDALAAARRLLAGGPVRLKAANADGGRGQIVARNESEAEAAVAALRVGRRPADGVVIEENIEDAATYSVGTVRLPGRTLSYCGTQSLTRNREGAAAYGGSILLAVPGGFDRLLARPLPDPLRQAVLQAAAFDALADRHLPGLIASRRNYDVISGLAADGTRRAGVLEQSWRMGGATGAELAALEVFAGEPRVGAVIARTVEVHEDVAPPADATVYFRGHDPALGPLTKYACVEEKIED